MKIHGSVHLIIGLFIVGFSYYISKASENTPIEKFMLFILVGAGFALFGLFKLISGWISAPREKKVKEALQPQYNQQNGMNSLQGQKNNQYYQQSPMQGGQQIQQQQHVPHAVHQHHSQNAHHVQPKGQYQQQAHPAHHTQQAHKNTQIQRHVKHCVKCGAVARHFDKFCYKCGNRSFR